ncbi:hypothetical protein Tco_0045506, partial [Tanacetum coccineum]
YAIIDSGCSGSMTGDKDKLSDFKEFKGVKVHTDDNVADLLTIAIFEGRITYKVLVIKGLMLLGDLNIIWETGESSDDDFWKDQEEWEIIRWRFHESSGVHTLEIEDGTMIHMLAERRYPLSRELMIRMLEHGMEVEDESETAITLIHLFILWTTENGDNS